MTKVEKKRGKHNMLIALVTLLGILSVAIVITGTFSNKDGITQDIAIKQISSNVVTSSAPSPKRPGSVRVTPEVNSACTKELLNTTYIFNGGKSSITCSEIGQTYTWRSQTPKATPSPKVLQTPKATPSPKISQTPKATPSPKVTDPNSAEAHAIYRSIFYNWEGYIKPELKYNRIISCRKDGRDFNYLTEWNLVNGNFYAQQYPINTAEVFKKTGEYQQRNGGFKKRVHLGESAQLYASFVFQRELLTETADDWDNSGNQLSITMYSFNYAQILIDNRGLDRQILDAIGGGAARNENFITTDHLWGVLPVCK